ncbi:MAG: DUF4136 domain-containing protein [Reichenbachiella sp.]|uniref:DUF4136 domain-containing protein n=1 Tax=Reichenbachiella sp. TaxID=2184521 RepID=UPI00329949D2
MYKIFTWIVVLILFQTCAPPKVIKFLNDDLDYSKYLTYRLIYYKSDDKSFSSEGMAFYSEIEMAIDQNMIAKGYKPADRPDLIARYEIISTTVTETNTRNYDPYGYNSYYIPQNAKKHTEGIVLIELRDRRQKKLVWQGSLDLKSTMKGEVNQTILQSINRIFETYPYQAGSNERIISEK